MAVGGGLTEIAKKKRERQRRKGKIYSSECRVPKTSKERESLPNRSKKQMKPIEWKRLEISSRKLRDTKGTFHAKIGTIEDRNSMDLTEVDRRPAVTGSLSTGRCDWHTKWALRGRSREDPMPEGRRPRGVTPSPRSGAAAESARL